jgi:hypothetical protein
MRGRRSEQPTGSEPVLQGVAHGAHTPLELPLFDFPFIVILERQGFALQVHFVFLTTFEEWAVWSEECTTS